LEPWRVRGQRTQEAPGAARRSGAGPTGTMPLGTCPVSTEGGTRRVQLVREGGGGGRGPPEPCPVGRDATACHAWRKASGWEFGGRGGGRGARWAGRGTVSRAKRAGRGPAARRVTTRARRRSGIRSRAWRGRARSPASEDPGRWSAARGAGVAGGGGGGGGSQMEGAQWEDTSSIAASSFTRSCWARDGWPPSASPRSMTRTRSRHAAATGRGVRDRGVRSGGLDETWDAGRAGERRTIGHAAVGVWKAWRTSPPFLPLPGLGLGLIGVHDPHCAAGRPLECKGCDKTPPACSTAATHQRADTGRHGRDIVQRTHSRAWHLLRSSAKLGPTVDLRRLRPRRSHNIPRQAGVHAAHQS